MNTMPSIFILAAGAAQGIAILAALLSYVSEQARHEQADL